MSRKLFATATKLLGAGSASFVIATLAACAAGLVTSGGAEPADDPDAGVNAIDGGRLGGEALVKQHLCATCHTGSDGELAGSDSLLPGTQSYGSNLTPDPTTGLASWSDDQIGGAIRGGTDDYGRALCPSHTRYPTMSDEDLATLVTYLRGLPAVKHAVPASVCPPTKGPVDSGATNEDSAPPPAPDSGALWDGGPTCGDFVEADTPANCVCKATDAAACQPNGCFGGYYCLTTAAQCWKTKPTGC